MKDISISGIDRLSLFGRNDQHLAHIEKKYGISLVARGDKLTLKGPDASVREADGLLSHLIERMRHGPSLDAAELDDLIHQSPAPPEYDQIADEKHVANTYKTTIRARTAGQAQYLEAIDNNDIVFGIGPAGTGKTYLAWEYACRAGTSSVFSFGDDSASLSEHAWHLGNSRRIYHQVGMKTANAWGLHDMYGNVLEWCFDWYGDYPSFPVVNPLGALRGKGRVLRGGGYTSAESQCRSGSRDQWAPISRSFNVGFRVVLGCPL